MFYQDFFVFNTTYKGVWEKYGHVLKEVMYAWNVGEWDSNSFHLDSFSASKI